MAATKPSFICARGGCGMDIKSPDMQDKHNQKMHNTCSGCTGKTVPPKDKVPAQHCDDSHGAVAGHGHADDEQQRMHENLGPWPLGAHVNDKTLEVHDSEPVGTDYSGGRKKLPL